MFERDGGGVFCQMAEECSEIVGYTFKDALDKEEGDKNALHS